MSHLVVMCINDEKINLFDIIGYGKESHDLVELHITLEDYFHDLSSLLLRFEKSKDDLVRPTLIQLILEQNNVNNTEALELLVMIQKSIKTKITNLPQSKGFLYVSNMFKTWFSYYYGSNHIKTKTFDKRINTACDFMSLLPFFHNMETTLIKIKAFTDQIVILGTENINMTTNNNQDNYKNNIKECLEVIKYGSTLLYNKQ